jgi:radical SAM protein with 4Fe4S-binding SPASM domain
VQEHARGRQPQRLPARQRGHQPEHRELTLATEPIAEITLAQLYDELQVEAHRIPIQGTIETTFRCNLNCVHCYVNQPVADRAARERELGTARLESLIDEIAEAGCLSLLLTGGEVLVRPDFPRIYLHALRRGLQVTVFTNGTLITDRIADLFDEFRPAGIEITLYGMTRATYERVTRVPGSFDRCLDGIRKLVARRLPLKLKAMALTWNVDEVPDMRAFARDLGLPFAHDSLLNGRVDCGANRNPELQLPPEKAVALDLDDPETVRRYRFALAGLEGAPPPAEAERLYSCGAGQIAFTVDPTGQLQLCQLSRRSSFDLAADTFQRGWNEHFPRLREKKWQTHSVCRRCSLISLCGSCAGASELEHGDPETVVAHFCEITHLRSHAVLGEASGHKRDASCCLGRPGSGTKSASSPGCGSCSQGPQADRPLIQLQRRRLTG